ncbi:UV damage endonuclease UvsE [Lottiidibacillus patelloidae]|uniref:UV damage endonuclease UvsE n=1 Tax=Lottiidibacillus patelloidae TaxID=2670334 RepID=A0A263BPT5_9BACI|nr:UV DNA damage repair endonuclease UvsE [Lottiidibacillus patelloidae]OZM55769.1 UV damage endonuclease UvsE [Lottiidibacillus patelloidae]
MTIVRLGYVAMSMQLKNSSPSQTMTFAQFEKLSNREAAIRKLERIAKSNLQNCLRLLKHNVAHDIRFFRFSSKLIPLANHPELEDWNFMRPLKEELKLLGNYIKEHNLRVDFHPDHFVLLNSPDDDILKNSIKTLQMHKKLLIGMGIDPEHRCVMHVGGSYKNKEAALERFITNFGRVPESIQRMIMLENDDTTFTLEDTLYLCEKLGVPLVFDYHHHLAHHENENWQEHWERIVNTWSYSPLPIKMHISSPKSEKQFRHHADVIDSQSFMKFLNEIKGSVEQIDCMIEAKKKDIALFTLMRALAHYPTIEVLDGGSFKIKG